MQLATAVGIVLSLASTNVLEDPSDERERREQRRQEKAIELVEAFFDNWTYESHPEDDEDEPDPHTTYYYVAVPYGSIDDIENIKELRFKVLLADAATEPMVVTIHRHVKDAGIDWDTVLGWSWLDADDVPNGERGTWGEAPQN